MRPLCGAPKHPGPFLRLPNTLTYPLPASLRSHNALQSSMSATTALMPSSLIPHDPQLLPDRPNTPRPESPPQSAQPAHPLPSPASPPSPNALDHPLLPEPAEKAAREDRSSSPMELEDSLDDPDMNNDAAMSEFAHEIDSDVDYLAEDLMNDLRRVKVPPHRPFFLPNLCVDCSYPPLTGLRTRKSDLEGPRHCVLHRRL
jgi:hypothetical protein